MGRPQSVAASSASELTRGFDVIGLRSFPRPNNQSEYGALFMDNGEYP